MKKIIFWESYKLSIPLLLIVTVITSCQKESTVVLPDNTSDVTSSANARRTNLSPLFLRVTLNDADGYKITSDAKGAYVNGTDNVSAYFDEYGNLQFDTNPGFMKKRFTAVRWMNFSFDNPVSGYSTANPANITTNPKGDYRMVTQIDGQTPAQSMTNGGSEQIKLGGGFTDGSSSDWNFSFHYNNVENTSYAILTRIDTNTWSITGAANPPVARLINSSGGVTGFYNLPFSLTLSKL